MADETDLHCILRAAGGRDCTQPRGLWETRRHGEAGMSGGPHLNQPGGRFRPSAHEAIRGRERELRSLADAVRRLVRFTVTNTESARETGAIADELHALADRLEPRLSGTPPPRYAADGAATEPHDHFQYDVMLGLYNPLALPIEMDWEPPRAIGRAHFTTPYEGPPGCVHGAVLAGAFDQIFNVANLMRGVAGPTRELSLSYRRPTPLHADLVFEGWVEEVDERRTVTVGQVRHGDRVTVESRGVFVRIGREQVMEMARRHREPGSG